MAKRKKYRRMTHYPGNLNVAVTDGTKNAVEAVADQAGWSVASTVRECINAGLPVVRAQIISSREKTEGVVPNA